MAAFVEKTFIFPGEGGKYQFPMEDKTIRRIFHLFTSFNLPKFWDSWGGVLQHLLLCVAN